MNWIIFLIGLILLAVGLEPQLAGFGVPAKVVEILLLVPTFSLNKWIFVGVGAVLIYFGLKR